jgi:hypothetical protein
VGGGGGIDGVAGSGLIFVWPAVKAASLDPVEALVTNNFACGVCNTTPICRRFAHVHLIFCAIWWISVDTVSTRWLYCALRFGTTVENELRFTDYPSRNCSETTKPDRAQDNAQEELTKASARNYGAK